MKNLKFYFPILFLLILLFSCKDEINTSADFRERYVLNSLVNCDTSMQIVFISKTYDDSKAGINPTLESVFIHNADVKIWNNYNVHQFSDTIIFTESGEHISCYYSNKIDPEANSVIEIEALLPNNLLLKSETRVPNLNKMTFTGSNTTIPPSTTWNRVIFNWTNLGNNIYSPRFSINYFFISDTGAVRLKKAVPIDVVNKNGKEIKIFPEPSNYSSLSIPREMLEKTLIELSDGIENKMRIVILNAELSVLVFDENLSAYYSSTHEYLDQFSISLDQSEFTNINGGMGIFGSYIKKTILVQLSKDYIRAFGYKTGQ